VVAARGNLKVMIVQLIQALAWAENCLFARYQSIVCDTYMMKLVVFMFGLSITTAVCDDNGEEAKSETQIMVIALGAVPARKYSNVGSRGDAAMLLPEVGEVPPNKVYYKSTTQKSGASSKWRPISITFNNTSVMYSIKAGRNLILYRKIASGYEPYVFIAPGEVGMRRVVLLTQPSLKENQIKPWQSKPKVTIITVESALLSNKQFAIKNLSRLNVIHAFDQEVANVRPGQLITYSRNRMGILYHLAARYGKQRKMIYNLALTFERNTALHLYVLYDANPKTNAGRSVAVLRMML
jgi:hypothetical protein